MTSAPRAVIFGCEGLRLSPAERQFFAASQPWGAILFARNIDTPAQVTALTAELRDAVGRDLPVLIDQEGGRVARMRAPHWRDWPTALEQCDRARDPERAMALRGQIIARELRAVGIDVNCAPLADIAIPQTHAILHNRCYGRSMAEVVRHARAMAEGLMSGGVLPVLKHIPGHGRATLDSHLDLPVIDAPGSDLSAQDFAAFKALADLPLGMTAHLVFAQIDPAAPATQSPRMIRLIRDEIGFDGLLMTDDISMQALRGPVDERARAALAAGCDLVLHCNGEMAEMQALAEICPQISGPALLRSERALILRRAPEAADMTALDAAYRAAMG
ncbi:MAG: beta-N-acetylhexosaminidase [Rhodobacteraceae bacterium]|nr:MAG: beta-N-acetylhexosaminidase [Paracoccaceae bacterium]